MILKSANVRQNAEEEQPSEPYSLDINFCGNQVVDNINLASITLCHTGEYFCILCKLEKVEQRYRKLLTLRKPGALNLKNLESQCFV